MRVKLEFGRVRSSHWDWVRRLAAMQPTYAARQDAGVEVHSVEFEDDDLATFKALLGKMITWKSVAVWVDGKLVDKLEAFARVRLLLHRRMNTVTALDQLSGDLQRKAAEAGVRFTLRWKHGREKR